jgi:hypothetical protein
MPFVPSTRGHRQERQRLRYLSSELGHFRGSTSEGLLQSSGIGWVRLYGFGVGKTGKCGLEFGDVAGDEREVKSGIGELLDNRLSHEPGGTDDSNFLEGGHFVRAIGQVGGRGKCSESGAMICGANFYWRLRGEWRHVTNGCRPGSSLTGGVCMATHCPPDHFRQRFWPRHLRRLIAITNPYRAVAIMCLNHCRTVQQRYDPIMLTVHVS